VADKKTINLEQVSNPELLVDLLNAIDTEVDALRTLANELRTDHATNKTSHDAIETLVEELRTDHLGSGASYQVWLTEVDGDLDDINDYLSFIREGDGPCGGNWTVTIGAATTLTGAGFIEYRIDGVKYYCDLDTTITLADDGDVDDGKWRAWRVEIDRTGAVTATADGDTQHTSEEDALLNMCALARTANTACLGYFTIHSNGGFDIGTNNVNGESAAHWFYERGPLRQIAGLTASMGADIDDGTTATNYSTGTRDYMVNGLRVAQDAAEGDKAFDDNDTIGEDQFGGHLIVTNLAQSATYALATDGKAGAVTAMTHADEAAVLTALATILGRLPANFAPCGYITVENKKAGTFTYNTDDIQGTDGQATYVSFDNGGWDRTTDEAGTLSQFGVEAPTIPGTVTAPIPAAIESAAPASGPGTLDATAVSEQTEQGR